MTIKGSVRLNDVSKVYPLFATRGDRLREALNPFGKRYHDAFWALRNVSFDIEPGRTLGVLGLNGSGKSTLLQIIAGVLEPSSGTVSVDGRVAALLELGAGFNPDLSGRENVITNALVMGLSRQQAAERLDEVEAFAEIGRHFSQPVKTYSSGMFMRVAFAMSICVDPDILIIDEALAVGDVKFQEKCFRRLHEFKAKGRTILFVTHDRASVIQLCDDAILLHHGQLLARGAPKELVNIYTELLTTGRLPSPRKDGESVAQPSSAPLDADLSHVERFVLGHDPTDRLAQNPLHNKSEQRWGNGGAKVVDALLMVDGAANPASVVSGREVELHVKIAFETDYETPLIGFTLTNTQGVSIYGTHSGWLHTPMRSARAGEVRTFMFRLDLALAVGACFIELAVARDQTEVSDVRSRALHVDIARDTMLIGLVDMRARIVETSSGSTPAECSSDVRAG